MKTEPVYIVGPTASGKTARAVQLAKRLRGEIVSADSMQVYRGMNIGTAKPTASERAEVPHHLIDILDLDETFSVARFKSLADTAITDIRRRGGVPLVVGGTGLYVKSLTEGIFDGPSADWDLRKRLRQKERDDGPGYLYGELRRVDPESAERIKPADIRRIIRALEVHELAGRTISDLQKEWERTRPDIAIIGLTMERDLLNERIDNRVDEMFRDGLLEETKRLIGDDLERNRTAMQAIGYKEVVGCLNGEYSLDRARELLKRNSRRYAKRQLTWFRKDDRIRWFDAGSSAVLELVANILTYLAGLGYDPKQGGLSGK